VKELYNGVWAEKLKNNQSLPVGDYVISGACQKEIILDFKNLKKDTKNYDFDSLEQLLEEEYKRDGQMLKEQAEYMGLQIDPYLLFVSLFTKKHVSHMLQTDRNDSLSHIERNFVLFAKKSAKLSDMKGISSSYEQSALAQYLLQNFLAKSQYSCAYMSGMVLNPKERTLKDNAFVIINDNKTNSYVLDISQITPFICNIPSFFKMDCVLSYRLFKGTDNLLIRGNDILSGNEMFFGITDSISHKKICFHKEKSDFLYGISGFPA